MKITVDTEKKELLIEDETNFKELIEFVTKHGYEEYKLKALKQDWNISFPQTIPYTPARTIPWEINKTTPCDPFNPIIY